ncbi:MAG: ABC transporter permease [Rhodothermales bacterium]|nr:ABC transporter permease [Rhodothermales bacterium]MBO6781216.1 ABC transporter permease [Rhodothermales bacterium]
MWKNILRVALRGMRRDWSYTLLNVSGLALGFVAAFLILMWINDEMAFNTHYDEVDRVHRVMRTSYYGDRIFTWPAITAKLDEVLDEEYAEIEKASLVSWSQHLAFRRGDQMAREGGLHAGPDFFRILSHDVLAGDPADALKAPESIALSESMARKYFPAEYASGGPQAVLGGTLVLEDRMDVVVTMVYADPKPQATYRPDFVLSMEEFTRRNDWVDSWGNNGLRMLVTLTPNAGTQAVSDKIADLITQNNGDENQVLFLQPLKDVYLRNNYEGGVLVGGRIDYLRIFAMVGVFVLLIAAINFTNLATARATQRAREVGVRKTFGSGRGLLVGQFLSESTALALLAFVLAGAAVMLALPWFNEITAKEMALGDITPGMWLLFLGVALTTGLTAGWYPALHLSSFSVIGVLRRNTPGGGGGLNLRRVLVVFQFALSVLLVIGAAAVSTQLDYIRSKHLGLDRENVFYSQQSGGLSDQYDAFRAQAMSDPSIASITTSSSLPIAVNSSTSDGVRWDGKVDGDNTLYSILTVGHDFVETMRMELAAGRGFSREFATDSANVVINERAAAAMGFENPVGQTVTVWGRTGQIVGVVEDFHFTSLYQEIDPLVLRLEPSGTSWLFVRPAPGGTDQALAHFSELFRTFNPTTPLETTFLDDRFDRDYRSEAVIQSLARGFTLLAVVVACLGLFGLAAFAAARRRKEIGVRKVLGATVPGIVALLSREFLGLVLVAFVVAMPVAWVMTARWLDRFAYHAELGWSVFGLTALVLSSVALATVSLQALRAARLDPARTLRAE